MNSPTDRRSEIRLQTQATIFVEICSAEPDKDSSPTILICSSLDISANGVQVQMDDEVPLGSILRLCADFGSSREPIYLIGETKWVTPCDDLFNIGFEILDAENSDIMDWKNLIVEKLDQ
jgi:hypothetical protein